MPQLSFSFLLLNTSSCMTDSRYLPVFSITFETGVLNNLRELSYTQTPSIVGSRQDGVPRYQDCQRGEISASENLLVCFTTPVRCRSLILQLSIICQQNRVINMIVWLWWGSTVTLTGGALWRQILHRQTRNFCSKAYKYFKGGTEKSKPLYSSAEL
jgi:hypothetical protein